ncbi:monocarboxylate transporter 9-like [Diadema setosum]|uniref:monocarboxylate transporter 9-like n=1 Tax=Diadema setosum TaxID=31175 RepID=UPI003B3B0268
MTITSSRKFARADDLAFTSHRRSLDDISQVLTHLKTMEEYFTFWRLCPNLYKITIRSIPSILVTTLPTLCSRHRWPSLKKGKGTEKLRPYPGTEYPDLSEDVSGGGYRPVFESSSNPTPSCGQNQADTREPDNTHANRPCVSGHAVLPRPYTFHAATDCRNRRQPPRVNRVSDARIRLRLSNTVQSAQRNRQVEMGSVAADKRGVCGCRRQLWGWVVTGASFLLFVLLYGPLYAYSVLFIAFQQEFGSSATVTGWVGSIPIGGSVLLAPVVNILAEHFSYRTLSLIGIVLSAVGLISSSFVRGIGPMFVTYSAIFGTGAGLVTVCALALILLHFPQENCMRATAIALCGTSTGMLAGAPLMSLIISTYGWRTLLRILGAVCLGVGIPCVLTYSNPSQNTRQDNPYEKVCIAASAEGDKKIRVEGHREYVALASEADDGKCGYPEKFKGAGNTDSPAPHLDMNCRDYFLWQERPITPSGGAEELLQSKASSKELVRRQRKGDLVDDAPVKDVGDSDEDGDMHAAKMWRRIGVVLAYPELWSFTIAVFIYGIGECFYFVNMVSYMMSVGFSEQDGANVVFVIGISNFVCKLTLSFLGEYLPFPRLFLMPIYSALTVSIMVAILFIRSLVPMIVVAVVIGGILNSSLTFFTIPSEFFGPKRALETWGVILFAYGTGYFVGSFIGQSIDATGSYRNAIWAFIGLHIASGMLFVSAPIYQYFFARDRLVTFDLHREKREARNAKKKKPAKEKLTIAKEQAAGKLPQSIPVELVYDRITSV